MRTAPELCAAAAALSSTVSLGHRWLVELATEGERAQALRSAEGLARTSRRILTLPLGDDAYWIGKYYEALAMNRRGRHAFPEANEILIEVADHGPELFRAKALAAIGTNLSDSGDNESALKMYAEAARIARACEGGDLQLLLAIRFQIARIAYAEGDERGSLSRLEALGPLALQIGIECPPLLQHYYNNLAVALAANGRLEEALYFSEPIAESPFSKAYPEWGRTRSDLLERKRTRSGSVVSMSNRLSAAAPSHPETLQRRPAMPAATAPVGDTRRQVSLPAALKRARIATGIFPTRSALHRNLFARHLSFSPTPNTEARPLSPIRLDLEPVRERRRVRRPSADVRMLLRFGSPGLFRAFEGRPRSRGKGWFEPGNWRPQCLLTVGAGRAPPHDAGSHSCRVNSGLGQNRCRSPGVQVRPSKDNFARWPSLWCARTPFATSRTDGGASGRE
jgi:tetratricopeptide (TPR) repeat protein